MNKKLLVLVIVVSAALFTAGGILAKAVPDMIKLQDPAYKEHKKGVVEFTHGKHQTEYAEKYPEFYKIQKCIECHKIAAEAPKGKKAKKKLSKKEKIKDYHAEALHENCRGCHRKYNKKYKPAKKAPTTCTKCHPKKAK
jgi:hypothetical protein